ncbi:MAG TPA: hypothetical protein PLU82_01655 [Oscillospiraceae bacterium]|nr:hypothetical protein [Oscillospiraceae bacterium]
MAFIISQITHNTNIFHRRGSCPFLRQTDPPAGSAGPSDSMRFRPNDAAVLAGFFLFRKKIFRAYPEKRTVLFLCVSSNDNVTISAVFPAAIYKKIPGKNPGEA